MYSRILVPLDGSDAAAAGLEQAITRSRRLGPSSYNQSCVRVTFRVTFAD
jgi:nucleotide-binding universal stress UspA family protein